MFAQAYGKAAANAIDRLRKAAPVAVRSAADRHMVSVAMVKDPITRRLFGVQNTDMASAPNVCAVPVPCKTGDGRQDGWCLSLIGLIAQGVTEALAGAGRLVLPPLNWQAWTGGASDQVSSSVNIYRVGTASGLSLLKNQVTLAVSHVAANKKVIATLEGILEKDVPGASRGISYRGYKAYLDVVSFETPNPKDCGHVFAPSRIARISDAKALSQTRTREEMKTPPPTKVRRAYGTLSVVNAIRSLEHHAAR